MKKRANRLAIGMIAASVLILGILAGLLLWKIKELQNGYLEWEQTEIQRFLVILLVEILFFALLLASEVWICAFLYREMALKILRKEKEIAVKDLAIDEKEQIIAEKTLEIDETEQEIIKKEEEITAKEQEITEKEQEVTEKERKIAEKEREIAAKKREIAAKAKRNRNKQEVKKRSSAGETGKDGFENCRDEKTGVYNVEFAQSLLASLDARKVANVHVAILKARFLKKEDDFGWKNITQVMEQKLEDGQTLAKVDPKHIAVICIKRNRRVFEAKMRRILNETEEAFKRVELRLSMTICSKLTENGSIVEILKETIEEKREENSDETAKGKEEEA